MFNICWSERCACPGAVCDSHQGALNVKPLMYHILRLVHSGFEPYSRSRVHGTKRVCKLVSKYWNKRGGVRQPHETAASASRRTKPLRTYQVPRSEEEEISSPERAPVLVPPPGARGKQAHRRIAERPIGSVCFASSPGRVGARVCEIGHVSSPPGVLR